MAFSGVVLLLLSELHHPDTQWLTGIAMALGAAFFYAVTALITRHLETAAATTYRPDSGPDRHRDATADGASAHV